MVSSWLVGECSATTYDFIDGIEGSDELAIARLGGEVVLPLEDMHVDRKASVSCHGRHVCGLSPAGVQKERRRWTPWRRPSLAVRDPGQ